jgi:HAD superfamily hydrolase (TIGR01509 family)
VVVRIKPIDFTRLDRKYKLPAGTIRTMIKTCTREAMMKKQFNERRFFEKRFSHLLPWTAYARILKNWFATERVNAWLIRWIERKRQQYRVYLLTNQTGALPLRLKEKYRIAHHFDRVFNSAEIGIAKPDPRIFRHLLRRLKVRVETCLFIDDKEKNIAMARALGFHVIHFKNNPRFAAAARKLNV